MCWKSMWYKNNKWIKKKKKPKKLQLSFYWVLIVLLSRKTTCEQWGEETKNSRIWFQGSSSYQTRLWIIPCWPLQTGKNS